MSTTSAPRGLKPIGILGGLPFAGSTREYLIRSTYGTAIFNGDVVGLGVVSGDDDGYIVREVSAQPVNPIGVFLGCSYTDPNTSQPTWKQYYPGSITATDIKAVVAIHPYTLYELQMDGAVAQVELGMTFDLVDTSSGSTITGNSGIQGDASTTSVGGECFKLIDFIERAGSTIGDTYTDCVVMLNPSENAFITDTIT
tara:strand:- start:533 stop:1126 length:594 start_codon:yes stop_codon:yes gene_type:complete